jgi:hypothetical protein
MFYKDLLKDWTYFHFLDNNIPNFELHCRRFMNLSSVGTQLNVTKTKGPSKAKNTRKESTKEATQFDEEGDDFLVDVPIHKNIFPFANE